MTAAVGGAASRLRVTAAASADRLVRVRPATLLVPLCIVQLGITLWIAVSSTHNHFIWYSGGDATEYWTSAWSLAHGEIGQTIISYGIPVLYAWVPLLTGTTLIGGLPVITVLQAAIFVPLALVLFWAVADVLFGRLFAWWATALWILGPPLMLAGFDSSYAPEFKNLFLAPHWYGLTNMADMPSLVVVLASAWAALRLLARRTTVDAVLTGLFTGALIGIKPANGFFIIALLILLAGVRDVRLVAACGAALAPAVVTLALWKMRGLGHLPIASYAPVREAAGIHPLLMGPNTYVKFDWGHLNGELNDLRSAFWSLRLLEFFAVAGTVAAMRRSTLKGAFVAVWFAGFCLLKGSSQEAAIVTVSYWRFVEPGLPAFILLAASVVYLWPRQGRPFVPVDAPRALAGGWRTTAVVAAVLALVPLIFVAAAQPAPTARYARIDALANDAPLSPKLSAGATASGGHVHLVWHTVDTGPTHSYYVVYRSNTGNGCELPDAGAKACMLQMDPVGTTRTGMFDDKPGRGRFWYRVGLFANYRDSMDGSDLMLLGPATEATVR